MQKFNCQIRCVSAFYHKLHQTLNKTLQKRLKVGPNRDKRKKDGEGIVGK